MNNTILASVLIGCRGFSMLLPAALLPVGITIAHATGDTPGIVITHGAGWSYSDGITATEQETTSPAKNPTRDKPDRRNPEQTLPTDGTPGSDPVRRYITREEKLEAGRRRELASWLYATTLAEFEWHRERKRSQTDAETDRSSALTLQGGLELVPAELLQANIVLEYDSETDNVIVDELVGAVQWEPFELEAGKQGLPFGEYFSRFATGPLIEFAETTETAAKLTYELGDLTDLSVAVYRGSATNASGKGSKLDYATAVESEPFERLSIGLSYLSDLADSDERLLMDTGNRFVDKVSALGGYAFWTGDRYELSMEYVSALDRFRELEEEIDKPSAWNVEIGLLLIDDLDLSFRLEGSSELEDAPQRQVGVAATLLLQERSTLTFELLQGRFRKGFVTDDDNTFDDVTTIGLLFSLAL